MNYIQEIFNLNNLIIYFLVAYISVISIYIPINLLSILNKSLSKFIILSIIVYYIDINIHISIFLSIALLITINLYNTLYINNTS